MFGGLLGMQFLIRETGWAGTTSGWLMPAGELLITRPISRQRAYMSLMVLYFVILLLPSLLNVGLTMAMPDLRISLYHGRTQSTAGWDKLDSYQKQFPKSTLFRAPKGNHDTLLIPFGAVLIALWQLWLAILLALALQTATLLKIPSKAQIGLFMAICFAPMFAIIFRLGGDPTALLENTFFFFVDHWGLNALLTLGLFVLVQRMALRRVQELEFI
jgi:hypothetical protein